MRKAIKRAGFGLAALLGVDAVLALASLPSLVSDGELSKEWPARIAIALMAIGNFNLLLKPRPGGIVFSAAVLAGTTSLATRHDLGITVWVVVSLAVTVIASFDYAANRRTARVEAIYARIEEEIIDGSLSRGDKSITSAQK